LKALAVYERVVPAAEQRQIVQVCAPALGPVEDVVGVQATYSVAAREAASLAIDRPEELA